MNTKNLSTLKIHKLTQAQYDRELEAGRIDATALYLTPDEEIDLSPYATEEELHGIWEDVANMLTNKADINHEHDNYLPRSGGDMIGDLNMRNTSMYLLDSNGNGVVITGYYNNDGKPYLEVLGTENDERVTVAAININRHAIVNVTTDSYLVGNGAESMIEKTPDEVWSHIKSAGKNVEGEKFTITGGDDNGAIFAEFAEQGAEVFNSYDNNVAIGLYSHAENYGTKAIGDYSHAEGYYTIANDYQHASGKYNEEKTAPATADTQDSTSSDAVFLVGCGTSTTRGNALRISSGGRCFGSKSFGATGADFAELFEWADGNPDNEDRRGLFATLDGDKIKLANADDDYIGVISGDQAFIGNTASEEWQGKYLTDVFGTRLYQEIETPDGITTQYILNPDYNPDEKYIMRENRKEWGVVGLLGQVVVVDDGTCVVGGYVKPSVNGVGTASDSGYRVMKRIDKTHVKVLVK